ncbi:unnamed protein product [Durusdinium trenchii]|uniref:Uncharacterized protein n=2 Tax=Durusdinium trenchii TaxID=1381693 RepID=A0ABP0IB95_9DINO
MLRVLAWLARVQGYDWQNWFNGSFPTAEVSAGNFSLYSHGVNNAVAVKWAAAWSDVYGPPALAEASLHAWQQLQRFHGLPSGAFGADEHLAGRELHRGTELCVVVESMRSLEETYAALPDRPELVDALEALAFNALPAAVSGDHWSHQYLTQNNAIFAGIESASASEGAEGEASPLSEVFGNVGLDATMYGISPNFPCCTVNFAQGWGKFVALGLWLFDPGTPREMPLLLSAALAPSTVKLPMLEVELETIYPFNPEASLRYVVRKASTPFQLLVRVPCWAELSRSEVRGPQGAWKVPTDVSPRPSVFTFLVEKPDVWEVRFAARWQLVLDPQGSAGHFSLGPLIFVKPLAHQAVPVPLDDGPYGPGPNPPPAVRDEMLLPTEDWAWVYFLNESWEEGLESQMLESVAHFDRCPSAFVPGALWRSWAKTPRRRHKLGSPGVQVPPQPEVPDFGPITRLLGATDGTRDLGRPAEVGTAAHGMHKVAHDAAAHSLAPWSSFFKPYQSASQRNINQTWTWSADLSMMPAPSIGSPAPVDRAVAPGFSPYAAPPSMWLQPPQGLPMPAPIVMPSLDALEPASWEQQADLANKARQMEALQNHLASLQRAVVNERERAARSEGLLRLKEEARKLSPSLSALTEHLKDSEDHALVINQWFASEGPKIKGWKESTDPSLLLLKDLRDLRHQVSLLGARWQQLEALLSKAPDQAPPASPASSLAFPTSPLVETRPMQVEGPSAASQAMPVPPSSPPRKVCSILHARGSMMMRCELCNFDACNRCVASQAGLSPLPPERVHQAPTGVEGAPFSAMAPIPEDGAASSPASSPGSADARPARDSPASGDSPVGERRAQAQFTSFHIKEG